jgi:hypothetical protein
MTPVGKQAYRAFHPLAMRCKSFMRCKVVCCAMNATNPEVAVGSASSVAKKSAGSPGEVAIVHFRRSNLFSCNELDVHLHGQI